MVTKPFLGKIFEKRGGKSVTLSSIWWRKAAVILRGFSEIFPISPSPEGFPFPRNPLFEGCSAVFHSAKDLVDGVSLYPIGGYWINWLIYTPLPVHDPYFHSLVFSAPMGSLKGKICVNLPSCFSLMWDTRFVIFVYFRYLN